MEPPMEQPTTSAEVAPEQQSASSAIAAPARAGRHSGGVITRGAGVGLARQWRTVNLIANVVAVVARPPALVVHPDDQAPPELPPGLAPRGPLSAPVGARGTLG